MQEIKAWIHSHRPYSVGLELYRKYGQSAVILMQLEAAEHSYNRKKLLEELTALAGKQEETLAKEQYKHAPAPPPPVEHVDDALKPIYQRKAELYKQAGRLHAIDLWSDKEEERGAAAIAIMEKMDENGECWDKIRYYEKHGMLPNKESGYQYLDAMDPVELLKLRNNNRAYISKTKKKVSAMEQQDEKYRAFQKEIDRRTKENQAIEKLTIL